MKKSISVLFVFLLLASYSCKEKVNYAKENEAIMAVLEEETAAYYASDFLRWSSIHLQDSTAVRMSASKYGHRIFSGWESISANVKAGIEAKRNLVTEEKKIHRIKIYGESAWVVYNNNYLDSNGKLTGNQVVVNILEKQDGKWKIVLRNVLSATGYYQADNNILIAVNYAKSLGKKVEDFAAYVGDQYKTGWNSAQGYNGYVSATITNWLNVVPAGELNILERDDNHIIFSANKMWTALKNNSQYNVTYDEYLVCSKIVNEKIADYMGAIYRQETTPDGVLITITKK